MGTARPMFISDGESPRLMMYDTGILIAKALNIRGCVNFEFVEEIEPAEQNGPGKWRFLECNPRFSGGLAFSAVAGYDMVRNHLNCFKGIGLEPEGEIREQYVARRYTEFVTG